MKADIKELWVDALLSGDYQQGQNVLCRVLPDGSTKFCCLGVLCDLAIRAGIELDVEEPAINDDDDDDRGMARWYGVDYGYLPEAVQDWAGLGSHNPGVQFKGYERTVGLATLNDRGTTFAEIAEAIRDQL